MGRAAAGQGEIRAALDELEFHWGSAYHIAVVDGMYTADYGVVLRALLFAADRHQARVITGAAGNAGPGRGPA